MSTDSVLTEDSILFVLHRSVNRNNYNPSRNTWMTSVINYSESTLTTPMTEALYERYYDYCKVVTDHPDISDEIPCYLYALILDKEENKTNYDSYILHPSLSFIPNDVSLNQENIVSHNLLYSSFLQIYKKNRDELYILFTENDELSGNFLDTFEVVNNGIYEIKNIPENYMLNITEVDTSFVEITGIDTSMSTYSFGDISYDFYHGNMYLKVEDNTEDICLNMMVYDTYNDISYNIGTKITIKKNIVDAFNPPSNDLSGLQFEYIANADKATSTEWTANYVVSGTNKITMNSSFLLARTLVAISII